MQTLTITDAKKNLGRLLAAAARGEEIGIVCGADIIALRKIEVEAADYAFREYGISPAEMARFEKRILKRAQSGELQGAIRVDNIADLKKAIAKTRSR